MPNLVFLVVHVTIAMQLVIALPVLAPAEQSPKNVICQGTSCPTECVCQLLDSGGMLVNCSFRKLRNTPDHLPINTEQLLLQHNPIYRLGRLAFAGCSQLQYLDLASNTICDVDKDAFDGLHQLHTLLLQRNDCLPKFGYDFTLATFTETTELRALDVHKMWLFAELAARDVEILIGNLSKLSSLSINMDNPRLLDVVSKMKQLEELYMYCDFRVYKNDVFQAFSQSFIKKLVMRCPITANLSSTMFSPFSHLEDLDLSYTGVSDPNILSQFWPGLKTTNIRSLELVQVLRSPYRLQKSFYIGFERTRLKKLKLDNNCLLSIGSNRWILEYLPYLEYLSLENNRLPIGMQGDAGLETHKHLKYLNLNNQLTLHPVAASNITDTTCPEVPLSNDVYSSAEECGQTVASWTQAYALPDSLEHLLIASKHYTEGYGPISFQFQLSVIASPRLRYFKSVNIGLKKIGRILEVGGKTPILKLTIDLSGNQCIYIEEAFGTSAGGITGSLLLSHNELGAQLEGDVSGNIFYDFTKLTELDLSYNMIKTLHNDVFRAQTKLEKLNLAQNNLQLVDFSFKHMVNLAHLDLSGNLLFQLSKENCHDLDVLATDHKVSVNLAHNPLECSCEHLQFLQWILDTDIELVDWNSSTCLYNHNRVVHLSKLRSDVLPELNVTCRGKTWLIASTVSLALTLFMIAISVVLYRHRFEVRYALLKLVIDRKKYDALNEEEDYVYDAFVAFDMADVDWVSDVLLQKLEQEGERRFHLCVHHRDFTGGTPIVENIADAICSSRKVIVVLTPNFLGSSWCQFELETTQIRSFEEGKDLIIPVLMEDLPVANMSKTLRVLLKRNTYIMWPEQEQERVHFWRTLRRALDSRPSRIIRCQCGNNINL